MKRRNDNRVLSRAFCAVLALVLVIGALFVPMTFSASADASETVFDFETASGTVAAKDGIEYVGYSFNLQERDGKGVLMSWNPTWKRTGASSDSFIFNKNDGETYKLTGGHTYMVTVRMRAVQPILNDDVAMPLTNTSLYALCYGMSQSTNQSITKIKNEQRLFVLSKLGVNSTEYTCDDMFGTGIATYPVGKDTEYHNQTYVFTIPEEDDGKELGMSGTQYYGVDIRFDDVTVTDLGTDNGVVATINTLTGEQVFQYGKKGEKAEIAPLADVGNRKFNGYFDESGENPVGDIVYGDTAQAVYGYFDGNATITFDALGITEKKSGGPDEEITFPEVPEFSGESKFIGWFCDAAGKVPFTETAYGLRDRTVYAYYSKKVTVTCHDTYNIKNIKVTGFPGENISLPEVRDNKHDKTSMDARQFAGWYTSSDFNYTYDAVFGNTFPAESTDIYSKWNATAAVIENFESYSNPGANAFGKYMEIKNGAGADGSKAAYYNSELDDSTNTSGSAREWKYGYIRVADLTKAAGVKFKVSFKAKVISADADFRIQLTTSTGASNYWENPHAEYILNVPADGPKNEWFDVETEYTYLPWYNSAHTEFLPKAMYIKFLNSGKGAFEVAVDDFKLEPITSATETAAVLRLMNDGGFTTDGETITDINYVDELIAFPENLEFEGRAFLGWSTDRAGSDIVTTDITGGGMLHGKQNIILWAQWDRTGDPDPEWLEGFENYAAESLYPTFGRKILAVTDEFKLHGDKSLRLRYDDAAIADGAVLADIKNCFHLQDIEDDTSYRVSFKYYAERSDCDVSLKPATSLANIWDNARNVSYDGGYTIFKGTEPGWKDGELYVHTKMGKNGELTGDTLFIIAIVGSNEGAEIYFDDFYIEKIDDSGLVFINCDDMNSGANTVVGKRGEKIGNIPAPTSPEGKQFSYWAYDKAGEKPFKETAFNETVKIYAIYAAGGKVVFTYEDYTYKPSNTRYALCDCDVITTNKAYSGNKVVEVSRVTEGRETALNSAGAFWPLARAKTFNIISGYNYIVAFKYMIVKPGTANGKVSGRIAHATNVWHQGTAGDTYEYFTINTSEEAGVWHDGAYALDFDFSGNANDPDQRALYLNFKGFNEGIVYFDDVTLIALPKGEAGIAVKQNGWSKVPMYVSAAPGSDYTGKLPQNYSRPNFKFVGYVKGENVLSEFKAPEYGTNIIARWIEGSILQDFDGVYKSEMYSREDYCVTDFDYELYDASAPGADKFNVTSGRYSLHRKGESMYFEAACLLNSGRLSEKDRYTVTFKVKMDSYKHTDGAVKIASNRSSKYPWHTSGDWYPVIAIADLTDGEWHEVSYTFNSVEAYASIMTPGYCSIYIDDVRFRWVTDEVPLSEPCTFTEYVVAKRDENGNIIEDGDELGFGVKDVVDASLKHRGVSRNGGSGFTPLWIIIPAAAAVIAGLLIFFFAKKKKKKDAESK